MIKPAKRADPLRARASRVKKSCHAQRDSRTLPSWYYRVQVISFRENREVNGYDFDEDLSELEEDKEQERDHVEHFKNDDDNDDEDDGCEYAGEDPECDCRFKDDDDVDEDDESERSYDLSL